MMAIKDGCTAPNRPPPLTDIISLEHGGVVEEKNMPQLRTYTCHRVYRYYAILDTRVLAWCNVIRFVKIGHTF